jgi:hypothetical protein
MQREIMNKLRSKPRNQGGHSSAGLNKRKREVPMSPHSLIRLFRKWSDSSRRRAGGPRPAKPQAFRPQLEGLEERTLLSVFPVSVAASGTQTGNQPSWISYTGSGLYSEYQESLSANGQFAVFSSNSGNLVSGPAINGNGDVYRRDLVNGRTSLVSINSAGTGDVGFGNFADQPTVTADGRYVAFISDSLNLTGNSDGTTQLYVRDMLQGQTYLVSLGFDGKPANNGVGNPSPSIVETNNGQLVITYRSHAVNMTSNDTNFSYDQIFVTTFNLDAGGNIAYNTRTTKLASADSTGNGANGTSDIPIISKDGSTLAFESDAGNLPGEKPNNADGHQHVQVFTYNLATASLTQVSPAPPAGQTADASWLSSISDNGRYLAYDYYNHNTGVAQVLAWDAVSRTNTAIFTSTGATYPGPYETVISGDGNTIAFRAGNVYGRNVIYADRYWQSGNPITTMVSPAPSSSVWSSEEPSISDNGQVIAYQLTPYDWHVPTQVYVWNNGATTEISTATSGGDSNGNAGTPAVSADAGTIVFNSYAGNLVSGINITGQENVFAYNVAPRIISSAAASNLAVSAPSNVTAGSPFNVTVAARDGYGNVVTGFNGTVNLSATDGQHVSPSSITLTNGIGTAMVALDKAGQLRLAAGNGVIGGYSVVITVSPAAMTVVVATPSTVTAGVGFNARITIKDAYGNGYNGPVTLSTSDGQALNVTTFTMSNGYTVPVMVLYKADSINLTATAGSLRGSSSLTINPNVLNKFAVSAPSTVTTGTPFAVTVTAEDPWGNTVTGVNGNVTLRATDGQISPSLLTLSSGAASTQVTLDKADRLYLDAVYGGIGGQSALMTVNPAAMTISFSAPSTVTAGSVFYVTITIKDKYGNGYNGPVSLTTSDGQKLNLPTFTMAGGITTAGLVLDIRDALYLTATAGSVMGSSNLITVS